MSRRQGRSELMRPAEWLGTWVVAMLVAYGGLALVWRAYKALAQW